MAKRRAKRTAIANQAAEPHGNEIGLDGKEKQIQSEREEFRDPEVERQIAAIKAIRDMEIEHLLTGIRLLRSYFTEEQLETPVLQFFKENLPNVLIEHGRDGEVDMKWKDKEGNLSLQNVDTKDFHVSLLRRMSMSYPCFSGTWQPFSGIQLPSTAGNATLDGTSILSAGNHALADPYQSLTLGMQSGLQTPGANSQRMSIGMTPKTRRQPKHGEMLLSVHGSPLGVYKEDNNMEAIVESEEG